MKDLTGRFASDELLVVGVGNPLRGDDAAGLRLADGIARAGGYALLQTEDVPEKYTREMRTADAETVLIVDAADMGLKPGHIRLLTTEQFGDVVISTHNCSLKLLAQMLCELGGKDVLLLGIQPHSVGFGRPLSETVKKAIAAFSDRPPNNDEIG